MYAHTTTTRGTLLARLADPGNAGAWGEFCEQYEEMIRTFARRQGVMGAGADDIVQDVLLSLTKVMPGFEYAPAKGKFRSYLKTIVVRAIIRRRQRDAGIVELNALDEASRIAMADDSLDAVWEEEWRQQHLRRAMRVVETEFSATDLNCFRAYVLDDEETDDVARRYSVSATRVYNVKHRVLSRLRDIIAKQVEDEG